MVEAATVGRVDHHFLGGEKASDDDALAQAAGGHGTDQGVCMVQRDLQPALLAGLIQLRHCLVVLPGEMFVAQRRWHAPGHVGVGGQRAAVQAGETQGLLVDLLGDACAADGFLLEA